MNKNAKVVSIVAIVAVVVLVTTYFGYDLWRGRQRCFDCGDGQRCTIDMRQFATQYSAYSLELETSSKDKAKMSAKINPVQLQQLSEATQNAREFRQYVVAGFNSCAVTKIQYGQFGARFQSMDNLVLRPLDYVTKLVSGMLARKLPLDGNPIPIHVTVPGPSLPTQASDVSDSAFP